MGLRGRGLQEPFFFPFFDGGFSEPGSPVAAEDGSAAETPQPEATNAEVRETNIVYHNYYDIGVAVGSGKGLVVPVLRNAERISFAEIERAIGDFAHRARDYITSQGLPRTITEDTLDLDATRQFNEQRGLSFRLPP